MSVTLITGAASGLGWAMAQYWYRAGHCLVLADIDAEALLQRQHELGDDTRVLVVTVDVTHRGDLERLVRETEDTFGRLDLLVNNAGITHRSPAASTDPKVFRKVMAVDWQGPVELTQLALPLLEQSGGSIITIGSMAGWMPVPGRAGYCAAKGALTQFFEVLRLELEPRGVHVLMVYPSFLDTPIEHNALGADGNKARHARSTIGGMSSADDMARMIDQALARRKRWLLPEPVSRFGSLLWRIAPALYLRAVRKRFAGDLNDHGDPAAPEHRTKAP
ncbi:SDR family oxidoreductase [Marinobacter zhanjiangensis]|uniref:Short chain dehydrogenase n=1 Tax=Marinobacter zhanjiangensis TaxID=578215 RepID=A0ABQ3AQC6_9GAMM|nr:SDR family oxidoreductase [Marinobacter zhanjiangensis]GGY60700.1 short chain dehydrogenase [Marinobacter zhanjiangensis]